MTLKVTEKTGDLIAIMNVTDEHDLMIVNKSGIMLRMAAADLRQQGRATQGVRLINLRNNDEIASVTRVMPEDEVDLEALEEGYEYGSDNGSDHGSEPLNDDTIGSEE